MKSTNKTDLEKEELLAEIVRLKKELKKKKKYGLVWEDKPEDVVEMCKTKLPILKEVKSKEIITDKNKPVNLLIEGDNYHALSVLNYTHAGKIDVIYIDPPYNTGNSKEWKYNDKWVDEDDAYRHSKYISFISSRLRLARNLLSSNGVIFISIGDNEIAQLKIICDECFGENNLLSIITRKTKTTSNKGNFFSPSTDYILAYARNFTFLDEFDDPMAQTTENYLRLFKYEDKRGKYNIVSLYMPSLDPRPNQRYFIICPDGTKVTTPSEDKMFRWIPETYQKNLKDDRVVFLKTKTSPLIDDHGQQAKWNIYTKIYLHERQKTGMKPLTFIDIPNSLGSKELIKMKIDFAFSKPRQLIEHLVRITDKTDDINILDFFAGSGTTGHAILSLNNYDTGKRTFILCTNNEENICSDICYPRIKKAIYGYISPKEEKIEGLGGNLKYFKTDFVEGEATDKNKIILTKEATEMLCIKEGTFELVSEQKDIKIFKDNNHYTGIIFDQLAIPKFKKAIKDIKGKFSVYIFSLSDETFDEEFADVKQNIKLSPIPEAILRVYRRIFK
jgi:adenine-specific DNA-methyltransferase